MTSTTPRLKATSRSARETIDRPIRKAFLTPSDEATSAPMSWDRAAPSMNAKGNRPETQPGDVPTIAIVAGARTNHCME